MRKGEPLYHANSAPIHFVPIPEVFVDITDMMVPTIQPYYMISNHGRVWHKYKARFLEPNIDTKGYLYKNLASNSERLNIPCRIHRLVMLGFCYRPDHANLLVNHKDGNPKNCIITNLEWATESENVKHAWENNLHTNDKYSPEKIHEVCKLLETGKYTVNDISKMTNVSYTTVGSVLSNRTHVDISSQYNISKRKVASNLTEDQVRLVCEYFQAHRGEFSTCNAACRGAIAYLNLNLDNTANLIKTLQKIYNKQTYIYISKDYNF